MSDSERKFRVKFYLPSKYNVDKHELIDKKLILGKKDKKTGEIKGALPESQLDKIPLLRTRLCLSMDTKDKFDESKINVVDLRNAKDVLTVDSSDVDFDENDLMLYFKIRKQITDINNDTDSDSDADSDTDNSNSGSDHYKNLLKPTPGVVYIARYFMDDEMLGHIIARKDLMEDHYYALSQDMLDNVASDYIVNTFDNGKIRKEISIKKYGYNYELSKWATCRVSVTRDCKKNFADRVRDFVTTNPGLARLIWDIDDFRKDLVDSYFKPTNKKRRRIMDGKFEDLVPMAEGRLNPHQKSWYTKDVWSKVYADLELKTLYKRYNKLDYNPVLQSEYTPEDVECLWNRITERMEFLLKKFHAERQKNAPRGPIKAGWYI
tara:strand:- start:1836 stop:2969 length:1134 start_codon:yes stop_codon:yes gene_type:complete